MRSALLALAFVVVACQKKIDAAPPPQSAPRQAAADARAWAGTTERWAQDWNAKRLEPVMAAYAPEAVFLTATGARLTGHAQLREVFTKAFHAATTDLRVRSVAS